LYAIPFLQGRLTFANKWYNFHPLPSWFKAVNAVAIL
jgi:hypothetical protein